MRSVFHHNGGTPEARVVEGLFRTLGGRIGACSFWLSNPASLEASTVVPSERPSRVGCSWSRSTPVLDWDDQSRREDPWSSMRVTSPLATQ